MNYVNTDFFVKEGALDRPHAANMSGYECQFDVTQYADALFTQHQIIYAPFLYGAALKRKAEFLAGRYVAQQAMKKWGLAQVAVGIGKHRSPVWPTGLVGSITHTAQRAICVVAQNTDYKNIGIDLAHYMSLATADHVKDRIIQAHEVHFLNTLPFLFEQSLTLTFSAKESLFKALYPEVGRYFGFHAAEIDEVVVKNQTFSIRLTQDLTDSLVKGTVFKGEFTLLLDRVLTSIFIEHQAK